MQEQEFKEILKRIGDEINANIFLFNAEITLESVDQLILKVKSIIDPKENFALILSTNGGDADAAYRMVRFIKKKFKKFHLYVLGYCKSAGTLIALGADEIIMSDFGELGPLDIQLSKEDDLIASISGLCYTNALYAIQENSFEFFQNYMLEIIKRSQASITVKTAAEIASNVTIGLFSPITSQIDPVKLGEVTRAVQISINYGRKLNDSDIVNKLTYSYPSHSYVIDIDEAKDIFKNVRALNKDEEKLEEVLFNVVRKQMNIKIINVLYPNQSIENKGDYNGNAESNGNNREPGAGISEKKKRRNKGNHEKLPEGEGKIVE